MKYILAIDQSTSSTKGYLFDERGVIVAREGLTHRQLINDKGYISHDCEEIYSNTLRVAQMTTEGIDRWCVIAIALTNQRETAAAWDDTGRPICNAVVWQCARGAEAIERLGLTDSEFIRETTGMPLSPYFSAAKFAWIMQNVPEAAKLRDEGKLKLGTMDSYLVYRLTGRHLTEPSNASRTQLMSLSTLDWDDRCCELFGIDRANLPRIISSDGGFGETDFSGLFAKKVPIISVMGDSQAALFGQNCLNVGDVKATLGTGSSVMMNIGSSPVLSNCGLVTSVGWSIAGKTTYVSEGNVNYAGAIINWLKNDLGLIKNAEESEKLSFEANAEDTSYLVPAFSGLGAPYWADTAKAALVGMTRLTTRNEVVKSGLEAIAYQINDVLAIMRGDRQLNTLCLDGGTTKNRYLMQFQSDISVLNINVSKEDALSVMGVAYLAGLTLGMYGKDVFDNNDFTHYTPSMRDDIRNKKLDGWHNAVKSVLNRY